MKLEVCDFVPLAEARRLICQITSLQLTEIDDILVTVRPTLPE